MPTPHRQLFRLQCAMAVVALALALAAAAPAADLRVVGTDLLGVEFSKALYAQAGRHGFSLALALDGSRPGLAELKAGRADAGLVVLPAEEEADLAGLEVAVVGYHRVVVLVPAGCPLPHVTLGQLAGIFGTGGAAPVATWGDLGVQGDWAASALTAVLPEVGTGVIAEFFRQVVLRDREFRPEAARYRDAAALVRRFGGETRVLALAPALPAAAPVLKALPVAARAGQPAFLPTAENVHSGDYVLRLPLRWVARASAPATVRHVRRFLLGDEAAAQLERAGVLPLPAAVRVRQLAGLEKL